MSLSDCGAQLVNIAGLVVSVGYSEELSRSIDRWISGLSSLVVVTSYADTKTQSLCADRGCRVHVTDVFYADGAVFNKGRAIAEAVDKFDMSDWCLLFDADVIPPADWKEQLLSHRPKPGMLYGVRRLQEGGDLLPDQTPAGYFLLFHGSDAQAKIRPLVDAHWTNAGNYDSTFLWRWPRFSWLPSPTLIHTGECGVNWCGRGNDEAMKTLREERKRRHGSYAHEVIHR